MRIVVLFCCLTLVAASGIARADEGQILPFEPVTEVPPVVSVVDGPIDPEEGWSGEGTITELRGDELVVDDILLMLSPEVTYHSQSGSRSAASGFGSGTFVRYWLDANGLVTALMKYDKR